MTQQDIAPDQSLNIILTKIASNWKLNLREINLDSNNHDYNSKKREAVEQKQQELEDKFLNVYQAKLLKITDFPQKEELVNDFILKIEELKISIQVSSKKYPDSESKKFRESVCDSIKTKLLQKKEELKQKKLERMEAQVEIIYPLSFDVEAKKDPLKTLLQSIIKPWNVELFPTEISKYEEDNFVKNSIKDKQSKFLSIIEFLIKDFALSALANNTLII